MGCRVKGMTVQEYRRSYDYRTEYFKQNPGLFGCIWFCSQCYRPLIGKKNVVVDHIRPLNKGGINHVSNCTAICQACNSAKSDTVDGRVIKGKVFKVFESTASKANRGIGAVATLGVAATVSAVSGTARVGGKVVKKTAHFGLSTIFKIVKGALGAITFPLRRGGKMSRLCFVVIYTLIILYFLSTKTSLLDAWL